MKKIISGLVTTIILSGCTENKTPQNRYSQDKKNNTAENFAQINKDKNTIRERFSPPENYQWQEEKPASFGYFIENFKLKPYGSQILRYDNSPISTQHLHEAVFDIDT